MIQTSILLTEKQKKRIKKYASLRDISMSQYMRMAIESFSDHELVVFDSPKQEKLIKEYASLMGARDIDVYDMLIKNEKEEKDLSEKIETINKLELEGALDA